MDYTITRINGRQLITFLKQYGTGVDFDHKIWETYFEMCSRLQVGDSDSYWAVVDETEGVGLAYHQSDFDADDGYYTIIPLGSDLSCVLIPLDTKQYEDMGAALCTHVAPILGGDVRLLNDLIHFQSRSGANAATIDKPVVLLKECFESTVDSLAAKNRYDVRRASKLGYTFKNAGLQNCPDTDWITNCCHKWYDTGTIDGGGVYKYAVRQILFAISACTHRPPEEYLIGNSYDAEGNLQALSISLVRGGAMVFSAFCSKGARSIGLFSVTESIKWAHEYGVSMFDPCAISGFYDIEAAYIVYKKVFVNSTIPAPTYYLAWHLCGTTSNKTLPTYPPYWVNGTWVR